MTVHYLCCIFNNYGLSVIDFGDMLFTNMRYRLFPKLNQGIGVFGIPNRGPPQRLRVESSKS